MADSQLDIREIPLRVDQTSIRTKLYRPTAIPVTSALVWMHGGGFVGGSLDMPEGDAVSGAFAQNGVLVLNVDYRRVPVLSRVRRWKGAPAVRYPTPVLDCLAAWSRLKEEADLLGLTADRVFIGGASAGGNLAVLTTLRALQPDFRSRQVSSWRIPSCTPSYRCQPSVIVVSPRDVLTRSAVRRCG